MQRRNLQALVAGFGVLAFLSLCMTGSLIAQEKGGSTPMNQGAQTKEATEKNWRPSGEQILEFVENSLKDPKMDRSQIAHVLSDIASGKAVFAMPTDKQKAAESALPCIRMACRGLPCALVQGAGWYVCSVCCVSAKEKSSSLASPSTCGSEFAQQKAGD